MPRGTKKGAENVAWMTRGYKDPDIMAVDGWIDSPGHLKNLVGTFTHMSVAAHKKGNGAWYLTQLFAKV